MLILGHIGVDRQTWPDGYSISGMLYPDVFIISPRVRYSTTHYLETCSPRALRLAAKVSGVRVACFADGMLKHLRDDRRLPLIVQCCESWARPIASQIRECLTLGALAGQDNLVERVLLSDVVQGVIEFALARKVTVNPLQMSEIQAAVNDLSVIQFIATQWSLDVPSVMCLNARWGEQLFTLSQYSAEELAWVEMRALWVKLVVIHLCRVGLLTLRESIMARRQIEDNLDQLLAPIHYASRSAAKRLLLELMLREPQPAIADFTYPAPDSSYHMLAVSQQLFCPT